MNAEIPVIKVNTEESLHNILTFTASIKMKCNHNHDIRNNVHIGWFSFMLFLKKKKKGRAICPNLKEGKQTSKTKHGNYKKWLFFRRTIKIGISSARNIQRGDVVPRIR